MCWHSKERRWQELKPAAQHPVADAIHLLFCAMQCQPEPEHCMPCLALGKLPSHLGGVEYEATSLLWPSHVHLHYAPEALAAEFLSTRSLVASCFEADTQKIGPDQHTHLFPGAYSNKPLPTLRSSQAQEPRHSQHRLVGGLVLLGSTVHGLGKEIGELLRTAGKGRAQGCSLSARKDMMQSTKCPCT